MIELQDPSSRHAAAEIREMRWLVANARAPRLRSMRDFAESEIIIPNGPHEGSRYRVEYQPVAGLFLNAVDTGPWNTFNATGPSQSGKTLTCSVIPLLYHLFEIGETVIFGLPDLDMASDKWREDIEPVIARTRYRDLIPTRGGGSRGGQVQAIRFKHGPTLRFMTGGGGDKSRAGYTSRVLVVTETDGMDEAGDGSREADKLAQLIARTRAFGSRRRVYQECTLTTKIGRTWRDYESGTASRIALRCPHCAAWVTPERAHLVGWQEATDEIEAIEKSAFCCPACATPWTEQERKAANRSAKLVHRGQEITQSGDVTGALPRTMTFGFRWSAANNLFVSAGDVGLAEYKRMRSEDEENAEKELCQFIWAVPYDPPAIELVHLSARHIMDRSVNFERGLIPTWCEHLTLGCDIGTRSAHWCLTAWGENAMSHIVDYGVIEIYSDEFGEERAILSALRAFRDDVISAGWGIEKMRPEQCLFDSRFKKKPVRQFTMESGNMFLAAVGFGATQRDPYHHPKSRTGKVKFIGEEYFGITTVEGHRVININSDHWKSFVHEHISIPLGETGAMSLFMATGPHEHLSFAKHLTSERKVERFVAVRGNVITWEAVSKNNHWLDALMLASVAGSIAGVRATGQNARASPQPTRRFIQQRPPITMPDGSPFLITER